MIKNQTILITGAAKRIGRHMAVELARTGYDIAIHYHQSAEAAKSLQTEIEELGQKARCFKANLSDEAETMGLFPRIVEEFACPTIVINNASIFEEDDATSCDKDSWDTHLQTNLRAPFILSQALKKNCEPDQKGHIVNIIDQRVLNLTPHFLSYTLSKSALWTLTQTLSMALAPQIQVNAIGPGPTLPSSRQAQQDFEAQWKALPLQVPTPLEDISNAVKFLLSSRSVTGQLITLDSGEHLGWAQPSTSNQVQQ